MTLAGQVPARVHPRQPVHPWQPVRFGHGEYLLHLAQRSDVSAGIETQAYIDIDSLPRRPEFGYQKQGASFGQAEIAGRVLLRKGLAVAAHEHGLVA